MEPCSTQTVRFLTLPKKPLKKVAEKGHQIIITTGRPYRMSKDFYRELGLDTPMINFNGSLTHLPDRVWDFEKCLTVDKKISFRHGSTVQRIIQADFIAGEYRKKFYITNPNEEIANPKLFGVEAFQPENQFQPELVTKDPNCILLQTRASDKYALAKEMNAFYQHQLSINTWGGPLNILECTPKGVNKAFALDYLLKVMNRDKKDLIAFGDEHNDTEMLAFAGKGYAMKNANPELFPYADEQISLTNDQDGVAKNPAKFILIVHSDQLASWSLCSFHSLINQLIDCSTFASKTLEKAFFCDIIHI